MSRKALAAGSYTLKLYSPVLGFDGMSSIFTVQRMNGCVLLCGLFFIAVAILAFAEFGETREDRHQISQHTKDLAAQVKADPDSTEGRAAMDELIEILNGNWSFAQCRACYAMEQLEGLAAPALPDLMRAANCGDGFVEDAAIGTLAAMGPVASPAVDLLIDKIEFALAHHAHSIFSTVYAAKALGNIGEPALKALPLLEQASHNDDKFLAKEAQKSLEKLQRVEEKREASSEGKKIESQEH